MEWSQAIQNATNDVRQINGRFTTARFYINLSEGCASQVPPVQEMPVEADAVLTTALGFPFYLEHLKADNGAITATPDSGFNRDTRSDESKTLNYSFLPYYQPGDATYVLLVCVYPVSANCNGEEYTYAQYWHQFYSINAPVVYGVRYGSLVGTAPPSNIEELESGQGDRGLRAMLPFPEDQRHYVLRDELRPSGGSFLFNGQLTSSRNCGSRFWTELSRLGDEIGADWVYGWGPMSGQTLVSLPGLGGGCFQVNAAIGVATGGYQQTTVPHESLHIVHRRDDHPPQGPTSEFGWDTVLNDGRLGFGRLRPDTLFDVFGDTTPAGTSDRDFWITLDDYVLALENMDFTVQTLRPIIRGPIAAPDPPTSTLWTLGPAWSYDALRRSPGATSPMPFEIRGLSQGVTVYSTFLPYPGADCRAAEGETCIPGAAGGRYEVPGDLAIDAIELWYGGVLQDTRLRSQHPPSVSISSPAAGSIITTTDAVAWTATDDDGDQLLADVLYSHDGVKWTFLALSEIGAGSSVSLSAAASLPGSSDAVIRVRVSDSFNTTEATVGGLKLLHNHVPQVAIRSPLAESSFLPGANVVLTASAYDPEDGWLEATTSWSSSLDGYLGSGTRLNINTLSSGQHVVTFRATDSSIHTTESEVLMSIR